MPFLKISIKKIEMYKTANPGFATGSMLLLQINNPGEESDGSLSLNNDEGQTAIALLKELVKNRELT